MTKAIATATRRTTDAWPAHPLSPEELRGRAAGVVVCAVMGVTWAASALGALGAGTAVPGLVVSVAVSAVVMVRGRRLRHASASAPSASVSPGPGADPARVRRRFALVVVAEGIAIAAAVNILSRSDHTLWLSAVVCAVVGLHFVPLARLFGVGLYYATGAAMCLVATVTMLLGAAGAPASLWRLLPGFGAAVALWVTGARLAGPLPTISAGPTVPR